MKRLAVIRTMLALTAVLSVLAGSARRVDADNHRDFMGHSLGLYESAVDPAERGTLEWQIVDVSHQGFAGTMLVNGQPYLVQGTVARNHDFVAVAFSPTGRGAPLILRGHMELTGDGIAVARGTYLFPGPDGDLGTFTLSHAPSTGGAMSSA